VITIKNYREKLEEILSEIHPKPDWMYLEEFRHQAPHLSKSKFREEIFYYIEAANTEADGMITARSMALKKCEEEPGDFRDLLKAIVTELEEHFSCLKNLPYGSREAPFMYKAGFEKVLKRLKEIEEEEFRGKI